MNLIKKNGPLLTQADIDKIKGWRNSERINPDGSPSTHLMASMDNYAFPMLFPNDDGSWTDYTDGDRYEEAFQEALKRGEVHEAETDEAADLIAKGAWKGTGELLKILNQSKVKYR